MKDRAKDLAERIRKSAKLQEPLALVCVDLVKSTIEDLKESLVMADGDDMLRTQGAVRAFQRLERDLTVEPPSIKPKSEGQN